MQEKKGSLGGGKKGGDDRTGGWIENNCKPGSFDKGKGRAKKKTEKRGKGAGRATDASKILLLKTDGNNKGKQKKLIKRKNKHPVVS